MDNSQFRNLINDDTRKVNGGPAASSQPFKTPMLGSRARSSIPMTPRSVAGYNSANDFARQVAEQRRLANGEPPTKKFRSSAAPKGTKLKQGYQDRTELRRAAEGNEDSLDDKEKRLKALEEMLKLQQIDEATFEKLKAAIGVGGDVSSTHLVKGLDWKLLEQVKKGEDINETSVQEEEEQQATADFDEELDNILEKEVKASDKAEYEEREKANAVSEDASTEVLSRDEILRRLKASRAASSMPPPPPPPPPPAVEPVLGDRFKRVGSGSKAEKKRFIETVKGRRREVLITTDKDGNTKRKVRWLDEEAIHGDPKKEETIQQPLGMEVPAEIAAKQKALLERQRIDEDDDDDIFAGVGADYDPLAGLSDESDESGSEGEVDTAKCKPTPESKTDDSVPAELKRNYFNTAEASEDNSDAATSHTTDPTILAALKKAAALRQSQGENDLVEDEERDILEESGDPERTFRRRLFLEKLKQRDRDDAQDLDLGFGESRFGDEDDEDGPIWEEGVGEKKDGGRKRGPKKRKGNKDNVNDVMSVIEGRKKVGP